MSQPEMRPEGRSHEAEPKAGRDRGGHRGRARGDLLSRAFPLGDWGEPAERLDELYQWVERGAMDMVAWYLADRRWKRRAARTLRGGTAVGVGAGAVLPLLQLTGTFDRPLAAWGFVALLGAAVCAGCDRWFGVTSGWMRDVATAQAVQRRLETLQYDWAAESIREVLGPTEGTAAEAADRCLGVLRRFTEDVTELVRAETADWMVEFRATTTPLRVQTRGAVPLSAGRQGAEAGGSVSRFPQVPGVRPHMPRQRPPDPPR
ncbi:SLATT domain-containing protein [Streptomyces sp. TR06-5]|uniref:SLATT domain-containing protein n=1 Tax=Streptomyces sp. TR06-5 TaxID=3385976 RepID=UPI0039A22416